MMSAANMNKGTASRAGMEMPLTACTTTEIAATRRSSHVSPAIEGNSNDMNIGMETSSSTTTAAMIPSRPMSRYLRVFQSHIGIAFPSASQHVPAQDNRVEQHQDHGCSDEGIDITLRDSQRSDLATSGEHLIGKLRPIPNEESTDQTGGNGCQLANDAQQNAAVLRHAQEKVHADMTVTRNDYG